MSEQEVYLGPYPCDSCAHWDIEEQECVLGREDEFCIDDPDLYNKINSHYEKREERK